MVVYDLLYNASERKRIDTKRVFQMKTNAENAVRKYYKRKKRAGVRPTRHEVDRIYRSHTSKRLLLHAPVADTARMTAYVRVIYELWKLIVDTPYCMNNQSRFHIKQHSIGMLYTMQMDFATTETGQHEVLLAGDRFLYENLPHQNDLREWRSCHKKKWTYSKQDVTVGRNNFKKSLGSIPSGDARRSAFDRMRRIALAYY